MKDVIKIRLHMWELKANNGKKGLDNRCPMCQLEENRILQNMQRERIAGDSQNFYRKQGKQINR